MIERQGNVVVWNSFAEEIVEAANNGLESERAVAETLGSSAAVAVVDSDQFMNVGTTINANHVRGVSSGHVTGTARPLHLG